MHFFVIFRVLGILLMLFSLTQLPPAALAMLYEDGHTMAYISAFFITIIICKI